MPLVGLATAARASLQASDRHETTSSTELDGAPEAFKDASRCPSFKNGWNDSSRRRSSYSRFAQRSNFEHSSRDAPDPESSVATVDLDVRAVLLEDGRRASVQPK